MAGERQTEPHQAEYSETYVRRLRDQRDYAEAEVARLRAERDELRRGLWPFDKRERELRETAEREHARALAAEARVAELEGNLEAERAQAAVEIEQLRQAQNRVAELEAERDRLKDESRIGWLERALAREQTLRTAAEDRIDRAVTERTAGMEAALREAISWSYGEDVTPERRDEIEAEFLAPTRTQEASDGD